jgi:hypothetical protein
MSKTILKLFSISTLVIFLITGCKTARHSGNSSNGFVEIFDGKTLNGWEGDPVYWRVDDGNLVGEITPATVVKRNTFIIWRGGKVEDFELKVQYRITKNGNSGINYRSEELSDLKYAMRGYQGDIDGYDAKPYTGMNYEERGRTTIAKRGQKVVLPPVPASDSLNAYIKNNAWTASVVTGTLGSEDSLKAIIKDPGNWNDYHIIAKGNHLQHFINGVLTCDIIDNDPAHSKMSGLIGVQVHVGPPMKIEYRHFMLKNLK